MPLLGLDEQNLITLKNYYVDALLLDEFRAPKGVFSGAADSFSKRDFIIYRGTSNEITLKEYRGEATEVSENKPVRSPPIEILKLAIKDDLNSALRTKDTWLIPGDQTGGPIKDFLPEVYDQIYNHVKNLPPGPKSQYDQELEQFANLVVFEYQKAAETLKNNGPSPREDKRKIVKLENVRENDYSEFANLARAKTAYENSLKTEPGKGAVGDEITQQTIDERANSNRLSEQAALILSMEELWSKTDATKQIPQLPAGGRQFRHFAPIRFDKASDTPTGHFFLSKFFTKTKEMNTFFNNLPPQVMSFLLPSIKLYKTMYPDASKDTNKGYDWRIPFDDVPVHFDKVTSAFVSDIEKEEKILSGKGTFKSVGIKSFSYDYRGTNPAEINTNIHANLKIFFQSPALLIEEINILPNDPRFVTAPFGEKFQPFSYSDLINQQPRNTIVDGQQKINEKYYRIKVECGYASVNKKMLEDVLLTAGKNKNQIDAIYKAITSTKVALFLSPYKYDVNFQEDGTVELSIDFNASMDTVLSSDGCDIFQISDQSKTLLEKVKAFEEFLSLKEISKPDQPQVNNICNNKSKEEVKKIIDNFKQQTGIDANTPSEKILEDLTKVKLSIYNTIFKFLLGKENIHKEGFSDETRYYPTLIWNASYYPELLGVNYTNEDDKLRQRIETFKRRNGTVIKEIIPINNFNPPEFNANPKQAEEINKRQIEEAQKSSDIYNIKFIFLGDIIDIALKALDSISPEQDIPRIVLGNIPITVPVFEGDLDEISIKTGFANKKNLYPNLADIPVSFNLFQDFMLKNVVEQKRTRYSLLEFIKDILSQLVYPAIQPAVIGNTNAINAAIRFSTTYLTFKTLNGKDPISGISPNQRYYPEVINAEVQNRIQKLIKNSKSYQSNNKNKPTEKYQSEIQQINKFFPYLNYIFITCSTRFPKDLKGDEQSDKENGIIHIRMGTETGIVKKVNFERMQIPYQREIIARNEGKGFGTGFKQYYNAKVEMFGNDIFRPGDYIYIHPNYIYNKSAIDLTDKLGIGGYYLILDSSTEISDGFYNTKINCVYQATVVKAKDETGNTVNKVVDFTEPCAQVK